MNEQDLLAARFEENRIHLRAVAYRMLGSLTEADDAVQEAWLRLNRSDASDIENLPGWLTTVVGRICLSMLRARRSRREHHVPDPVVSGVDGLDPESSALVADSVGLALLVVLDTLTPAERLAFVLHDLFAVPFDEIAPVIERSPAATRQLASRARRRVQDTAPMPDADLPRQREVVDAFFAASRNGDFAALVAVLDPDVVLRSDGGDARPIATLLFRGAQTVAEQATMFGRKLSPFIQPVLVNGTAGVLVAPRGRVASVMAFTVRHDKITSINVLADPTRLDQLNLAPSAE